MNVIEKYIAGKYDKDELCEDAIVATDGYIAVVDGVSSKSHVKYDGKSTGKIASELIVNAVKELDTDIECIEAIRFINRKINDWYRERDIIQRLQENPGERPAASAVVYSKGTNQLWMIGDCKALYQGTEIDNHLKIDELTSNIRSEVINFLINIGFSEDRLLMDDLSFQCIEPILNLQPYIQNSTLHSMYDYAVFDGFAMREDLIRIVQLPSGVEEVVLSSDGYPKLFPTLKETEEYLHFILEEDPLCYKYFKSQKGKYDNRISFDDRAYIRFKLKHF